jgi:hypothetical protein
MIKFDQYANQSISGLSKYCTRYPKSSVPASLNSEPPHKNEVEYPTSFGRSDHSKGAFGNDVALLLMRDPHSRHWGLQRSKPDAFH